MPDTLPPIALPQERGLPCSLKRLVPSFGIRYNCLDEHCRDEAEHESVSFVSLIYFLCLWLGVSTPLVFLGLLKGYKV